jgi:hypothetical protein
VPKKKFNADTCALEDDGTVDVTADFTPAGVVTLQAP